LLPNSVSLGRPKRLRASSRFISASCVASASLSARCPLSVLSLPCVLPLALDAHLDERPSWQDRMRANACVGALSEVRASRMAIVSGGSASVWTGSILRKPPGQSNTQKPQHEAPPRSGQALEAPPPITAYSGCC
jgi:hypothetical protein